MRPRLRLQILTGALMTASAGVVVQYRSEAPNPDWVCTEPAPLSRLDPDWVGAKWTAEVGALTPELELSRANAPGEWWIEYRAIGDLVDTSWVDGPIPADRVSRVAVKLPRGLPKNVQLTAIASLVDAKSGDTVLHAQADSLRFDAVDTRVPLWRIAQSASSGLQAMEEGTVDEGASVWRAPKRMEGMLGQDHPDRDLSGDEEVRR